MNLSKIEKITLVVFLVLGASGGALIYISDAVWIENLGMLLCIPLICLLAAAILIKLLLFLHIHAERKEEEKIGRVDADEEY
jgi:hypothetical protein